MSVRNVLVFSVAVGLAACSTVGQLTVKDYRSKTGEHVLAGQAEPKAEYRCEKVSEESQPWGIAGNLNRAGATEKITAAAVDSAPAKGANYVYISTPSEAKVKVSGFNVNAFKDAQAAYYKCANLPESAS
jgi:hypothetical protein